MINRDPCDGCSFQSILCKLHCSAWLKYEESERKRKKHKKKEEEITRDAIKRE